MNDDIDAVITWVDNTDKNWQQNALYWAQKLNVNIHDLSVDAHYRDWNLLLYVFRGIERYMPWIRMVHLVTNGKIPSWINKNCSKLHLVNHEEFIPADYLPTFNSNTIELNIHRIPGLAEQFIDFNDDMFVIGVTKPTDFFADGYPRDYAVISPQPVTRGGICNIEMNNLEIINSYFTMKDVFQHKLHWFSPRYGSLMLRTLLFSRFRTIVGIYEPHIPMGYLKSTMEKLWKKEPGILDSTCRNRFRTNNDVNIWLFRQWQLFTAEFIPRDPEFGIFIEAYDLNTIENVLHHPGKRKLICINDSQKVSDFENVRERVNECLNEILYEKSNFEL